MSRIAESRMPDLGTFVLRAENFKKAGYDLPMRPTLLGVTITDRLTGPNDLGHYVAKPGTHGDIIGALLWPNAETREIPAWSWAWPAILPGLEDKDAKCESKGCYGAMEDEKTKDGKNAAKDVYPMTSSSFTASGPKGGKVTKPEADRRFKALQPFVPLPPKTKLPKGTAGIVLCMTDESEQKEVFFPILIGGVANSIFAINAAGDREMGTFVYDTNKCFEPDDARKARLQSMMWVLPKPTGFKVSLTYPGIEGFLAWNIFEEGAQRDQDFAWGGAVVDIPLSPDSPRQRVVGLVSHQRYGPFVAGMKKDKHQIAVVDKGDECATEKAINSMHLSPNTFWIKDSGGENIGTLCHKTLDPPDTEPMDGPLDFAEAIEEVTRQRVKEYDNPTLCHLEWWERDIDTLTGEVGETQAQRPGACLEHQFFDKKRNGKWRWRSSCAGKESEGQSEEGGGEP